MVGVRLLAVVVVACAATTAAQRPPVAVEYENTQSPCNNAHGRSQRCQPVFMNAAFGRRVHATNTCGQGRTTHFCGITDKVCDNCIANDPYRQHPPSYLTDYNNYDNETWWQSDTMLEDIQYPSEVNLTLDLGKAFDITYVRLKFRSPRPESFAIYKKSSTDQNWVPYQYYSASCRDTYGLPDLVYLPASSEDRAVCTSEFSDISPLTGGSVAFATLEGRPGAIQFDYNKQLQDWVTATGIRITLNRLNTFGDEVFRDPQVLQSYYYAITDLAIGGTCKCNGHASNCVPSTSESGEERLVCQCQHNTAGADCQRCLPFYNDVPWRRATPDDASECKACNCNGYSNRCFFDKELFNSTGHGGHCTDCIANRDGVNCERCEENHYEREDGYCIHCNCDPQGSRSLQCNINGQCSCKPGVGGDKCDRCLSNFYDFSLQGCRECNCHYPGSLDNAPSCDSLSGVCRCKENIEGQMCDRCKPGFFSISEENQFGCTPCFCFGHSSICDTATGYSEVVPSSEFVRSDEGWRAETYYHQPVPLAYKPLVQLIAVSAPGREPVYFTAPDRFLGDQRASYNQDMSFTLRIGEYGPEASVSDVVLQGAGMEVSQPIFGQDNALPDQKNQAYSFRLHEHSQFGWSPRLRARDFISLLSNITAIKLRATYTSEGVGFLQQFALASARRGVQGRQATWVETCTCPPGYVGQFCESCEPGFRHEPANGGAFARCVPCDCNGHADICDAESGQCICRDNTSGDNCELCARGYYGNALGGTADDCAPCPCPGQGACIELYEDTVACLECPTGYGGHKCDICIDGWFGEPTNEQPCRECDCNGNVDLNAVGNCNRTTGECLKCIYQTDGFSCDRCLPGFFGDALALPQGDCRTCGCNPVGTVRLDMDEGDQDAPYLCDQLSGQCQCKPFVSGDKCERCISGYWNIFSGEGCEACQCDPVGAYNTSCDIGAGQCFCREGVVGRRCDECDANKYGFSTDGCRDCACDPIGSLELQCGPDGQCPCRENVEGMQCDRCKENKHDRHAGCRDCPPCYTLVQEAVDAHRAKLEQLSTLLRDVTDNPALPDDRLFEERLQELVTETEQLFHSAQDATSAERSPLQLLGDLEGRLLEVSQIASSIVSSMEEARLVVVQGERNTSEAEQLILRLETAVRETLDFLERDGADALSRALEQSKEFGIHSGRMTEIAQESRQLADQHEAMAEAVTSVAADALTNATAAYDLAYKVIEQQRNFSNEIQLLDSSVGSTEALLTLTRSQAEEAQRDAGDAYDAALSAYTGAKTGFSDVDVAGLKKRANELNAEAGRLKADLDALTSEHEPLLDTLETDADIVSELLQRGLAQQQAADELMADVDAARDKAEKAVSAGEKTLEEARRTLDTLQGFDRHVQESRDQATEALQQVADIAELIGKAERRTHDAYEALQGAESNADEARDIATEAEEMAVQARTEATDIQTASAETKERAAALRDAAGQLNEAVAETTAGVDTYEEQLAADSELAREAREKANQASSSAAAASESVDAALRAVREVAAALAAAGDIDTEALDQLEQRLTEAEEQLEEAQLLDRLQVLRNNRTQQDRMVRDYEEQLEALQSEVDNIENIADSLPTECYARVKLEP